MEGIVGGDERGREIQEGGDICILTADSLHCIAESWLRQ